MTPRGPGEVRRYIALKIAAGYAFVAALWILFSDALTAVLVPDPQLRQVVSTLKGWAFVAVTGVILYLLVRRYLNAIEVSENALRGSERRLERVVATVPTAVMIVARDGRITMANAAAQRLMRLPLSEILSRTFDDPAWRGETLGGKPLRSDEFPTARVRATGESVYDVRFAIVHPDGSRTILSANASPLVDENGEALGVVTATSDITEEYSAEQKIVHVSRLYSMLSQTNEAIVRIRDERELYAEACRITVEYGQFRMAWIGLVDRDSGAVRPAAYAGEEREYLDVIRVTVNDEDEGHGPVGTAGRLGRAVVSNDIEHDPYMRPWSGPALERGYKALAAFPLRLEGAVFGVFAIYAADPGFFDAEEIRLLEDLAEDIAFGVAHIRQEQERERTEEKLRRWKDIFDDTAIGVAMTEGADVTVISQANPAFAKMHGYEPDDVLGKPLLEFFPPEERDAMRERMKILDSVGQLAFEAMRLREDGSVFPAEIEVRAVYDVDGRVKMRVANVLDITRRRAAEEELARHRDHLEELVQERTAELCEVNERLHEATEAKSRFLANMSHELRTPLNSVIGFTGMMLQGRAGELNAEQEKQLGMVNRAGKQLLGVVNDVLEISKLEAGRMTAEVSVFELSALVEDVAATVGSLAAEKDLALETEVHGGEAELRTDRGKLAEVLVNVLANAVKFTDGGTVRLDARADGSDAVFTVTDTGIGIAAEDLTRIFDEFEQAKRPAGAQRSVRGTGLGLAISKRLTEMLDGTLTVESEPGLGSTFTLRVPRTLAVRDTKEGPCDE